MVETETFRVAAVSDNTNSFGLRQMVLIAQSGEAYTVAANSLNVKKQGEDIVIRRDWYEFSENGNPEGTPNFTSHGYEIPEKLSNAPSNVIKEVWGE